MAITIGGKTYDSASDYTREKLGGVNKPRQPPPSASPISGSGGSGSSSGGGSSGSVPIGNDIEKDIKNIVTSGMSPNQTINVNGFTFEKSSSGYVKAPSKFESIQQYKAFQKAIERPKVTVNNTGRAAVTGSKIIVNDDTGKQEAAIIQRGKGTEADIITFEKGIRKQTTVRGIPEYVKQETQKIESNYPKVAVKNEQREILQNQSLLYRKNQLEAKLNYRVPYTPEAKRTIQAEINAINKQLDIVPNKNKDNYFKPTELPQSKDIFRPIEYPVSKFNGGIKEGMVSLPTNKNRDISEVSILDRFLGNYTTIGDINKEEIKGGTIPGLSLFSPAGVAGAASSISKGYNFLKGTKLGNYAIGGAKALIVGESLKSGTLAAFDVTASKEDKEAFKALGGKAGVLSAGFRTEEKSISNNQWYMQLANDASLFIGGNTNEFKKGVRQYALDRGLSNEEADKVVKAAVRERTARGTAEITSFLGTSAAIEVQGGRFISQTFKNLGSIETKGAGLKLALKTFPDLFVAGTIEGSIQEKLQQDIRLKDRQILPVFNKDEFKTGILGAGLLGGLSSGVIGSSIIGTKLTKPKVSKTIQLGAYLIDPYEFAGDVTATGYRKIAKKLFGKVIDEPVIKFPKGKNPLSLTLSSTSATDSNTQKTKGKSKSKINNNPFNFEFRTESLEDKLSINNRNFINSNIPSNVNKFNPSSNIPIFDDNNDFIQPFGDNFQNTNTNTFIDTSTSSQSFSPFTSVTIPTSTPQPRIPPPIPFLFPFGQSAGGTSRKGSRSKFINEAELLGGLLGAGLFGTLPKNINKKTGKRGRK